MKSNKAKLPPRPYTEYLIFFQIERAFILQNLGVIPSLKPEDIFDPSDVNYGGPALPPRYNGLKLPSDWYVPGKGRRKKREHVATHRAIGFKELTQRIANLWRTVDRETKLFCKGVSEVGQEKYKMEKKLMEDNSSLDKEDPRSNGNAKSKSKFKSKPSSGATGPKGKPKQEDLPSKQKTSRENDPPIQDFDSIVPVITSSTESVSLSDDNDTDFDPFFNIVSCTNAPSMEAVNFVLANPSSSYISSDVFAPVNDKKDLVKEGSHPNWSRRISDVDIRDRDIIDMYLNRQEHPIDDTSDAFLTRKESTFRKFEW